jgi:hypothetical protein
MGEAKRRKRAGAAMQVRRLAASSSPPPITRLMIPAGPELPSREVAEHALAVAERTRELVRGRLMAASATGNIASIEDAIEEIGAGAVLAYEEEMAQRLAAVAASRAEMEGAECRRGCTFCCHVSVSVTPCEAIRIATAMRRGAIPDRSAAVGEGVRAAVGAGRRPCPLLVDGVCSAYAVRPFACRALFSSSAKLCEDGFQDGAAAVRVPSLAWPRFLATGYITGQVAALQDLGLASGLVELKSALAVLIGDETSLSRWLNGEPVFPRQGA